MSKIEVKNLTVEYGERGRSFVALEDVSFAVSAGEFTAVLGSSGCGKSTLLSVLEGILRPASGSAEIDGEAISGAGMNRSVVFQQYSLFPWMTARRNVSFAVKQAKKELPRKRLLEIADEFLEKVGLGEFGDKYPSQLSGGMQQRVAIARALAMDSEILLMDEPFGAIDPKNRTMLQELLLSLWDEGVKKTVVFVTHDIDEAIFLSDKIVMLTSSPGRVNCVVEVPFARPRERSMLMTSGEYASFRGRLMSILFSDVGDRIGGEEVTL